jgi:hypothetical protein
MTMTTNFQSADLTTRINDFVAKADEITANYWIRSGFTHSPAPTHQADYISNKWVRVVTIERGQSSSVYAFIALQDFSTKSLGNIKTGDIHKAATYKAPAKHARGSVFTPDFNNCLTEFGIVYMK